ncbi:MAG: Sec-independent protein translocase protein TatB [Gammaproteobacteria bacterium]
MFDIGFWELIVIAVVALLVTGPEHLPGLVRNLGRWSGLLRGLIRDARRELERGLNMGMGNDLERKISDLDDLMKIAPDQQPGFKPGVPRQHTGRAETGPRVEEPKDAG